MSPICSSRVTPSSARPSLFRRVLGAPVHAVAIAGMIAAPIAGLAAVVIATPMPRTLTAPFPTVQLEAAKGKAEPATIERADERPVGQGVAIDLDGDFDDAIPFDGTLPIVSPLMSVGTMGAEGVASGVMRLQVDLAELARLSLYNEGIAMRVPLGTGVGVALVERVDPFMPGAKVFTMTSEGERPLSTTNMQIWRGVLVDDPGSTLIIGVSPEQAHAKITRADTGEMFLIATSSAAQGAQIMAYDARLLEAAGPMAPMPSCAGAIETPGMTIMPPTGMVDPTPADVEQPTGVSCRVFNVALDTDNEFRNHYTSAQAASDYAAFLLASVGELYTREIGIGLRTGFVRIWDTPDPWTATSTGPQLTEFVNYWNANQGSTQRNLAHLLCRRSLGGGVAFLQGLCNGVGYAVSANLNNTFPYPISDNSASNWDLMVVAHELGHNFGSGHTHCNTAYSPIIDGCGLATTGRPACETGTTDCSVAAAANGSIMSYCHLCAGGVANMKMVFGPRPTARIQTYVNTLASSCGSTSVSPDLFSVSASPSNLVCNGSSVTLTASTAGANITYQWYRNNAPVVGGTSASLTIPSFTAARVGTYSVRIRNWCGAINSTDQGKTINLGIAPNAQCACNPADIANNASVAGPDGNVDNGDFSLFVSQFFSAPTQAACTGTVVPCAASDIADNGSFPAADGRLDNGDFSLFISSFFSANCP
jgi:hypothetical protein